MLYQTYPTLAQPVAAYVASRFAKGESLITQLPYIDVTPIGESAITQSESMSLLVETEKTVAISPWALFSRLSYTHILQLLPLADDLQRTFYAFEAIRGTWSVRELQRQIESLYYARSGWSKNPRKLARLTQVKAENLNAADFVKTDAVLEFLNLQAKDVWEEKDLEDGILGHLKEFILEMGNGMCFEARQRKILIDDAYERVDLVFYHRVLKCHVLIELKARKFTYADAAQLGVYLAYYRKHVMQTDDNPPVGILLCTAAGEEMMEFVNTFIDPQIFVSKYQLQLPGREKVTDFLKMENREMKGGAR